MLLGDHDALERLVTAAGAIKSELIARDPYEYDSRRTLGFGHALAHPLETVTGYGPILHGEAVSFGMIVEARMANARGLLTDADLGRIVALLRRCGLPTQTSELAARRSTARRCWRRPRRSASSAAARCAGCCRSRSARRSWPTTSRPPSWSRRCDAAASSSARAADGAADAGRGRRRRHRPHRHGPCAAARWPDPRRAPRARARRRPAAGGRRRRRAGRAVWQLARRAARRPRRRRGRDRDATGVARAPRSRRSRPAGARSCARKPLAHDLDDALAAAAAAASAGVPLQVGYHRRYDADYATAHKLVSTGALGRVRAFASSMRDEQPPPLARLREERPAARRRQP